jgi:hypothetical protein
MKAGDRAMEDVAKRTKVQRVKNRFAKPVR